MAFSTEWYGWQPQLPDNRDFIYKTSKPIPKLLKLLPSKVDLRPSCPAIYDQSNLGSCVANAVSFALRFDRKKQGLTDFSPSRLFIYYNGRALEGTTSYDSGLYVRDGIKTANKLGACHESMWPYNISQFKNKPTTPCYTDGVKYETLTYLAVAQNLTTFKDCLNSGFPIVFGFTVYDSFESSVVDSTGVVPMPKNTEGILGGHCVVMVGYDDSTQRFICANSWGTGWGINGTGYFSIPYAYLTNSRLAADFWTIKSVKQNV